jgi:hypothetical protein
MMRQGLGFVEVVRTVIFVIGVIDMRRQGLGYVEVVSTVIFVIGVMGYEVPGLGVCGSCQHCDFCDWLPEHGSTFALVAGEKPCQSGIRQLNCAV